MREDFERSISLMCDKEHRLFYFDITDSTNKRAMELIKSGKARGGEVFIAKAQSGGKGTRGRSFFSEGGLYMSVILALDGSEKNITQLAAVCVCRAIDSLFGTSCSVKWVNDIKLCGRKLCGILCEGCIPPGELSPKFAVIGIGVNTNVKEFPQEISNIATSLFLCGFADVDDCAIAAGILRELDCARGDLLDEYRSRCESLGRMVRVTDASQRVKVGVAVGIDDGGALLLDTEDGRERVISGDVFVI